MPRKSLLHVRVLHLLGKARGRPSEGRVPPAPGDVASLRDTGMEPPCRTVWTPARHFLSGGRSNAILPDLTPGGSRSPQGGRSLRAEGGWESGWWREWRCTKGTLGRCVL